MIPGEINSEIAQIWDSFWNEGLLSLLSIVLVVLILVGLVKLIIKGPAKNPTWKGIIISALIGLLPLYLVLCFLGWMGAERQSDDTL